MRLPVSLAPAFLRRPIRYELNPRPMISATCGEHGATPELWAGLVVCRCRKLFDGEQSSNEVCAWVVVCSCVGGCVGVCVRAPVRVCVYVCALRSVGVHSPGVCVFM